MNEIEELECRVRTHAYGNWSVAAEQGLMAASNEDVIIMDSDSAFAPGAIRSINNLLKLGHPVVQPRVVFLVNRGLFSTLISNARTHENRYIPKSYSPGLGLNREKLIRSIGIEGRVYNQDVQYGDDGYLNQTIKKAGLKIFVAEDAIIYHNPITLKHELKAAFNFGRGEYQIEQVNQDWTGYWSQIILGLFSKDAHNYFQEAKNKYGIATVVFILLWRLIYVSGYDYESRINKKNKT